MKRIEIDKGKLIYSEKETKRDIMISNILLWAIVIVEAYSLYFISISFVRNIFSSGILLLVVVSLIVIPLLILYLIIVEASLSVFRIYENGFVLHRRPLKYWLLRKEVYVPFKDIAKVYVGLRGYKTTPHSDLKLEPAHINYLMIETRNGKIYGINHRDWGNIKKESLMKLIETLKEKGIVIERNETHSIQSN